MGEIDWKAARKDAKAATALIPDGEYPFECIRADARVNDDGKDQVVADFLCLDERWSKKTVRNWFTVSLDSPIALDIFFRHMKVFGMDDSYFDKKPDMEDIASRMQDQKVTCTVTHSTWNGRDNNKINGFKKLAGGASKMSGGPAARKGAPAPRPTAKKTAAAPRTADVPASDEGYSEEPPF
jgi:hypothetical protein